MRTPGSPLPPPSRRQRWLARAYGLYLLVRGTLLLGSMAAVFVVVTALAGAWVGGVWVRAGCGAVVAVLLPIYLRRRLRAAICRRTGLKRPLGGPWFLVACNSLVLITICIGFADGAGRALRRRGDWFLGAVDGPLPRSYRRALLAASGWLERFELPAEARPFLTEPAVATGSPEPPLEGGRPVPLPRPGFVHPLLGPARAVPPNASCRFGAPRPGPRPAECELGHCGIDLVQAEGSPVHVITEGVVVRAQRDELAGGIAGRFLVIAHHGGALQSYYVHLQEIRSDLRTGSRVRTGEVIATLGRTGVKNSGPHLHFGLAVRRGSGQLYIDPEPLLRGWALPLPPRPLLAGR